VPNQYARRILRDNRGVTSLRIDWSKEALAEIKQVSKKEPVLAAEGGVLLLEKISPALEQVDSSSGASHRKEMYRPYGL